MMNRGEQFLCICLDKWGYLEEMIYKIGYEQLQDKFDIIGFNLLSIIFGNTISAHLNFLSYLNYAKPIVSFPKIAAIVVTYHPQWSELEKLLLAALPQFTQIIIVDNGSNPDEIQLIADFVKGHPIRFYALGENLGVAAAQNTSITIAKESGAQYIVLFDQDSVPGSDMAVKLLQAHLLKEAQGLKVAAVGPNYFNLNRADETLKPFVNIQGFSLVHHDVRGTENIVPVSHVIASGCLISMKCIDIVGLMREDLFIDFVDLEWAYRAKSLGFVSFGVCDAVMQHGLGEQRIRILGKNFLFHNPIRHYYQFRNGIWLNRQSYIPMRHRIGESFRLSRRFICCALLARPYGENLRMLFKGVLHGLTGRLGKVK